MKKYRILVLAVAMVLGVALAALAQQQDARRQRWNRLRKAQQQAIETIQQHAAKLKAKMQEMVKNMNRPQSDDRRNRLRGRWRKWREERLKFVDALESQLAILKGQRRLMAEHKEAIGELRAIRNLAKTEKAGKTVERLDKLIDKRQKKYEDTLQTLNFDQ